MSNKPKIVFCKVCNYITVAPRGPNSFNFIQFLGKSRVGAPWRVGAPTSGKSWIRHCVNKPFNLFQIFTLGRYKMPVEETWLFLGSLDEWIQKGYIRKDIWEKLDDYIEPELLTREKIDQCVKEKQNRSS